MSFQIKAELLLANNQWEKKLTQTQKQLAGFGKSMKTISRGVQAAVAFMGLDLIGDALRDVTKAAAQDAKSVALLNKQLENNWKATDATKESIGLFIDQMSNMSAIADDDLRPAFAKLAAVIKKPEKAMAAFQVALDVAAGTGKDVNTVSQAMAKFFGGNKAALDKLIPGIKTASDKMKFLKDTYGGMAAVAGNNDPFARITIIMDNFKEKLGTAFLPVLQKFSDWLASPEAQTALDGIAQKVQAFGEWFASKEGQESFKGWMDDLKTLMKLAADFLGLVGDIAHIFDTKTNQKNVLGTKEGRTALNPFRGGLGYTSTSEQISKTGNMSAITAPKPAVINVTVNGAVSGKEVVNAITAYARGKGVPMSKLLK